MDWILGTNYIDSTTASWPPHPWIDFNPKNLEKDFKIIADLGLKVIRVFLTAGSFLPIAKKVDSTAIDKLHTFLDIAKKKNLKVILTGPDGWEGWPSWTPSNLFTDPIIKEALIIFWETLAKEFNDNQAVYAWDILNEPAIDYKRPLESDKKTIYRYQKEREKIAADWVKFQSQAIKKYDSLHPVTLGFIQWSFPLRRNAPYDPSGYNPFQPRHLSAYLDFFSIHFYPFSLSPKKSNYGLPDFDDNLEYLLMWIAYAMAGKKPVQIGEFGMWGGGKAPRKSFVSQKTQADWGKVVIENTGPFVNGWINWPNQDIKRAEDISMFTGLIDKKGKLKKWGKIFSTYAKNPALIFKKSINRKIVPFYLSEKDILTAQSVEPVFHKLITGQKAKKIIYQIILK